MRRTRICCSIISLGGLCLVAAICGGRPALAQSGASGTPIASDIALVLNGSIGPDVGQTTAGGATGAETGAEAEASAGSTENAGSAGTRGQIPGGGSVLGLRGRIGPSPNAGPNGAGTIAVDGELENPVGPTAPVDGVIDTNRETTVIDGEDPERVDTRLDADRAAFNSPPAGYDPLLYQIEDIDPSNARLNRRPRRLFTREPYDPIGVRIGSFVLFPEIETALDWSSNVFASPSAQADRAYSLRPTMRLVSNWRAHAVELRGSGDLSTFDKFKSEDARGYELEARGRLDVTRRTNLQSVIYRQVSQESRSAVDASSVGERTDIVVDTVSLALNHRFNRLSLLFRGGYFEYDFGETEDGGAGAAAGAGVGAGVGIRGTINVDDRDYKETRQLIRAAWEFKPTLRVYTEAELIQRDYDVVSSSDGISRDSQGGRYRVGVDFGSTSDIVRGEISLGYADHRPSAGRLAHIDGLIVDGNLAWRVNGLTSLLFTASSDVTETNTAGSGGVLERRGGIELRHAFKRHLIGTAGVSYARRNISGIDANESDLLLSLGGEYFLNRDVVLFGNYGHTFSRSDFANSDYDLDEVRLGVRVRR